MSFDSPPSPGRPQQSAGVIVAVIIALIILALFACGGLAAVGWLAMESVGRQGSVVVQAVPQPRYAPVPKSPYANRFGEALNLIQSEMYAEAVASLEAGILEQPNNSGMLNQLAWLLATCPDDDVRDGTRAVELATRACELTNHSTATYVDTLAAAYAEAGDFDKAVEWQQQAILLAGSSGASSFRERLLRYQSRTPYREARNSQPLPADPVNSAAPADDAASDVETTPTEVDPASESPPEGATD